MGICYYIALAFAYRSLHYTIKTSNLLIIIPFNLQLTPINIHKQVPTYIVSPKHVSESINSVPFRHTQPCLKLQSHRFPLSALFLILALPISRYSAHGPLGSIPPGPLTSCNWSQLQLFDCLVRCTSTPCSCLRRASPDQQLKSDGVLAQPIRRPSLLACDRSPSNSISRLHHQTIFIANLYDQLRSKSSSDSGDGGSHRSSRGCGWRQRANHCCCCCRCPGISSAAKNCRVASCAPSAKPNDYTRSIQPSVARRIFKFLG